MQIKYPLIDKLKTPGISAWKPTYESHIHRLHEGVSGATFTLQDTEEAAQRSRVHPEHLAGRGEPTQGAGTETEAGALL